MVNFIEENKRKRINLFINKNREEEKYILNGG